MQGMYTTFYQSDEKASLDREKKNTVPEGRVFFEIRQFYQL
jgi:hypothetical protein